METDDSIPKWSSRWSRLALSVSCSAEWSQFLCSSGVMRRRLTDGEDTHTRLGVSSTLDTFMWQGWTDFNIIKNITFYMLSFFGKRVLLFTGSYICMYACMHVCILFYIINSNIIFSPTYNTEKNLKQMSKM